MPEFKDPRLQIEQGFLSYADSTINGSFILSTGSIVFPDLTTQSTAAVGGGSGTPGGSSGQIQYNNSSNFGGVPTLTYIGGLLRATGSFTGSFKGDGSQLTGVTAAPPSDYVSTASFNSFTASINAYTSSINTSSFATTGSNIFKGNQTITGSVYLTGSLNQIGDYIHTGSIFQSGSKFLVGVFQQTGSLLITGSTTQIGTNILSGNTTLSGSIIISGSTTTPATPTIKVYGDMETNGVIKFLPVVKSIDTTISGSYIYVSGSTDDLYFSQNGGGYNNVTRLRWIEGNLYTGLFNGGVISQVNSNTYQVASGSGIIVNLNASYNDNPYPTIKYINWGNLTKTIDALSASFDQQFVAMTTSSTIFAQGIPYEDGQYNTYIPLGVVVHQNHSSINAVQSFPGVAYGWKQRSYDFIRAFGPLKISGYTLAQSGSSTRGLVLSGGTSWVDGRNWIVDPNNPSYITEATGITTSKIYRYYQSGSNWNYDTNGGVGYTAIDPTQYSNNGTLTSVGPNKWTIQRAYYFPNSATKALYIYYGNAEYANQADALAAVSTENFTEAPNTKANAIYVGYMLLRNNANFTTPASYVFGAGGLFRGSGGSGGGSGGGSTSPGGSNTQIQYNNNGAFGGVPNLTWDGTTLSATGSFSGSFTGSFAGVVLTSQTSSMLTPYLPTSQTSSLVRNNQTSSMSVLSSSYAVTSSYIGGIYAFNYTASFTNQSTWTVNHNLGTRTVLIDTFDNNYQQLIPQTVELTNSNTATITFPTQESGFVVASVGGAYNVATASSVGTLNQSVNITGDVTASTFAATNNGNGTNFKVGDDTWIGDINVADTLQIRGQQNGGRGYIKFGTGSSNPIIGSSGTSALEIQNGYIQMPSRPAFRVTGSSSTNITAVTTLTSTQTGIDYNQGNYYTGSSGIFTSPASGLYSVYMNIRVGNNATSNQAIMYKNDTTSMLMWETSTNTGATHFGVSGVIYLATNDNLRVKVTVGTIQFDANDSWGATYIG